ncbi:hypothetical protein [Frankia sp. Cr1]|uniref:hypothetical protein n=1 Tax=Frankia sp. Cr1 TaxID=3073931 RepID=UPI002AD278E5|nr:hypothetical protein [Frankia sp. Cr1]
MAAVSRRPLLLGAVVVVVLAVGIAIGAHLGGPGAPAPSPSPVAAGTPAATGAGSVSAVPPAAILPQVDLSDVRFASLFGLQLPVSASAGPHDTAGYLASGYSHTPLGALIAAVNIPYRVGGPFGSAIFEPTIARQVVGAGADRDSLLAVSRRDAARSGVGATPPPDVLITGSDIAINGFRWESYTPDVAIVHVAGSQPDPSSGRIIRIDQRTELRWSDGDWRFVAPPGGDFAATATPIGSVDGYQLFRRS